MHTATTKGYLPYAHFNQPYGKVVIGFWEEYQLGFDGVAEYDGDFFELLEQFLSRFHQVLPCWEIFITEWRQFCGLSEKMNISIGVGPVERGFRFDLGAAIEPAWCAPNDIPYHVDGFNWLSFTAVSFRVVEAFLQQFKCEAVVTSQIFFKRWQEFIRVSAVIHNQTKDRGLYRYYDIVSYEEIWLKKIAGERGQFHRDLRQFVYDHMRIEGYFLPSHHLELWKSWVGERE